MTPHRWQWSGGARLLKCETSEGWIWPWVMDSALPRGQGVWVVPAQCLVHAFARALPHGLAFSSMSVCSPARLQIPAHHCVPRAKRSSPNDIGSRVWHEWFIEQFMVSQELCLASHTHDLIWPFHLPLGEIAAVIPGAWRVCTCPRWCRWLEQSWIIHLDSECCATFSPEIVGHYWIQPCYLGVMWSGEASPITSDLCFLLCKMGIPNPISPTNRAVV